MEPLIVHWLQERYPRTDRVPVGIGDDAAILDLGQPPRMVVTTDMLMDGVDFVVEQCGPARVGRKALAVNLSDLAAMAADPLAVVVSLALPRNADFEFVKSLYQAMEPLAREFEVAIAGGDTNYWDQPLVVCLTACGQPTHRGALLRSGAQPGDEILVTGTFGGSILGHHFDFQPRIAEARKLHENYELHAGMDVSDGLTLDLSRLAAASGCGAEIDPGLVPIAPAAHTLAAQDGISALQHALSDGEDFELILAVPGRTSQQLLSEQPLDVPLTRIGTMVAEAGLWQRQASGERMALQPRGYMHGAGS